MASFLLVLWLPILQMIFKFAPEPANLEKRELIKKPELSQMSLGGITQFLGAFDSYFSDNFGFRNFLVSLNSEIKIKYFKVSPLPKVVIGKDGWLFYNDPNDGVNLKDFSGEALLTDAQASMISQNNLSKQKWFADRSIDFLIVVPPNKHSIYPEYLPRSISTLRGTTRMDQIMGDVDNQERVLDLRDAIISSKGNLPLYFKTDTHWNRYGAYIGYREIMSRLDIQSDIYDFNKQEVKSSGDLAQMLSANDLFKDYDISAELKDEKVIDKKIMVFHDSFGTLLNPYFRRSFSDSIFIASPTLNYDLIEKEKPDIVIWEMVERYTMNMQSD